MSAARQLLQALLTEPLVFTPFDQVAREATASAAEATLDGLID